jgi:hypothetical protein
VVCILLVRYLWLQLVLELVQVLVLVVVFELVVLALEPVEMWFAVLTRFV